MLAVEAAGRVRSYLTGPHVVTPGDLESDNYLVTRFDPPAFVSSLYARTFGYITEIQELSLAEGSDFALVTYPYPHQVSAREWQAGRPWYHFSDLPTYSLDFFDRVRDFASQRGIYHIDTFDKFTNPADYPLSFNGDPHFRRRGYELMAEGIVEGILESATLSEALDRER